MTIVASVKVHDGIILGADSMTQLWGSNAAGQTGVIKGYEHAQKLYQVADRRVGVMAYGIGNIGPRSIGSFMTEFSRRVAADATLTSVKAIAEQLSAFLATAHAGFFGNVAADKRPDLGVLVGGYSPNEPLGEEWEFMIPNTPRPQPVRPPNTFGAAWRGVAAPFTRLYKGLDPRLGEALVQSGKTVAQATEIVNAIKDKFTAPFIFDGMPVQEAIEFVTFILETTINSAKFEAGAASCGGPLWIAVATPDTFDWVRKHDWRVRPH